MCADVAGHNTPFNLDTDAIEPGLCTEPHVDDWEGHIPDLTRANDPEINKQLNKFVKLLAEQPIGQRRGQWAFNALHRVRQDLATKIEGDVRLDPFYRDSNLKAFYEWVWANWFAQ